MSTSTDGPLGFYFDRNKRPKVEEIRENLSRDADSTYEVKTCTGCKIIKVICSSGSAATQYPKDHRTYHILDCMSKTYNSKTYHSNDSAAAAVTEKIDATLKAEPSVSLYIYNGYKKSILDFPPSVNPSKNEAYYAAEHKRQTEEGKDATEAGDPWEFEVNAEGY
ncbi:uncharacterized protein I206_105362 [Kwoniella pini CBS 10737]|uniref:Uncharacterized protein n=1 Tax=Kwoniella pini CBS 10737 TaxID=1296096 RepID=A0A1B9I4H3_9TREE|nr:uncharacterized protein I206_03729 [Kwoniella pini CBS 10737]OCF50407.1 hypothetical protein I206_03729 [Kwoniella pini CBS 10737]